MNEWQELIEAFNTEHKTYSGVIDCLEWLIEEGFDKDLQSILSHGRVFISFREQLLAGTHRSVSVWPCSDVWMDIGFEERWHIGEEENMRREQIKCRFDNAVPHFKNYISRLVADNKAMHATSA